MLSDQISGSSPSIYSQVSLESSEKQQQQETIKSTAVVDTPINHNKYNNSDSEPYSSSVDSNSGSSNYSSDESESNNEIKKQLVADSSLSSTGSSVGEKKIQISNCLNGKCAGEIQNRKRCLNFRNKNSVDSLSEDSGYCDHIGIPKSPGAVKGGLPLTPLSPDSSITTGNYLEDEDGNVIEEKSILHKNDSKLEQKRLRFDQNDDDICYHSMENLMNRDNANFNQKIQTIGENSQLILDTKKAEENFKNNQNCENENSKRKLSTSTPELFDLFEKNKNFQSRNPQRVNKLVKRHYKSVESVFEFLKDICTVSSVPDYINLLSLLHSSRKTPRFSVTETVASKDFNLYDFRLNKPQKTVDITASCANLLDLDYSDFPCYENTKVNNKKRNSDVKMMKKQMSSFESSDSDDEGSCYVEKASKSKELSSLLDEISAHFDRNLSILNDRAESLEPQFKYFLNGTSNYFVTEERDSGPQSIIGTPSPCKETLLTKKTPPAPPPRRSNIKTTLNYQKPRLTFDRDPTNLTTTYAESLERCTFDPDEPINIFDSKQNLATISPSLDHNGAEKTEQDQENKQVYKKKVRRNLGSSTPNLSYFVGSDGKPLDQQKLSAFEADDRCASMKEIPTLHGILNAHSSQGSKSGLAKGVSFCPIVSEISWKENVDYEEQDEQDNEPEFEYRNDSLVNYYQEDFSSEEDLVEHKELTPQKVSSNFNRNSHIKK
jgi:hypothetical protein